MNVLLEACRVLLSRGRSISSWEWALVWIPDHVINNSLIESWSQWCFNGPDLLIMSYKYILYLYKWCCIQYNFKGKLNCFSFFSVFFFSFHGFFIFIIFLTNLPFFLKARSQLLIFLAANWIVCFTPLESLAINHYLKPSGQTTRNSFNTITSFIFSAKGVFTVHQLNTNLSIIFLQVFLKPATF